MENLLVLNNDTQMVSARELHNLLGVEKRFSAWFETNSQGFIENEDFSRAYLKVQANRYGGEQELQDFNISIDMAKHICLMSRTDKGKQCRQYLIDLEKAWNTPEQVMARALRVAESTIDSLNKKIASSQLRIEEMRPKEIFSDAVSSSKTSILVRDLAKLIRQNGVDIGEKRLYKWLRNNGYVCKGTTEPTQRSMELGLFERVVRTVDSGNGLPIETITSKVTGKGQIYFVNKFLDKEKN